MGAARAEPRPRDSATRKMSATKDSKEKGKKARKGRDGDTNPSELGEPIDALSDVEVKMRLEAMDTFGKWWVY